MHLYISGVLNQPALEPTQLAAIAEGCDHNETEHTRRAEYLFQMSAA